MPPVDTLIQALSRRPEVTNITAISNNAGVGKMGLGALGTIFIHFTMLIQVLSRSSPAFGTNRQDDLFVHWRVSSEECYSLTAVFILLFVRNKHFEGLYLQGKISLELVPQGTLVERLGEGQFPDLVPSLLRTLKADTSGVDRQGAAQGLSEVLAGLGMERLEALLPDIVSNAQSPRSTVREGN